MSLLVLRYVNLLEMWAPWGPTGYLAVLWVTASRSPWLTLQTSPRLPLLWSHTWAVTHTHTQTQEDRHTVSKQRRQGQQKAREGALAVLSSADKSKERNSLRSQCPICITALTTAKTIDSSSPRPTLYPSISKPSHASVLLTVSLLRHGCQCPRSLTMTMHWFTVESLCRDVVIGAWGGQKTLEEGWEEMDPVFVFCIMKRLHQCKKKKPCVLCAYRSKQKVRVCSGVKVHLRL